MHSAACPGHRRAVFQRFCPARRAAEGDFAHTPGREPARLGNLIPSGCRAGFLKTQKARRPLKPRAEEHHVQRARGQQHEHQRDLQPVAGEFENRPHDLRMMERLRARVSNHIFGFGGRGFRTRLRVDSRRLPPPKREKAPVQSYGQDYPISYLMD